MVEILYLVRHGKAEGTHPRGDGHRALTSEGRARIQAMIGPATQKGFQAGLALSSPYVRAIQTRDLFAAVVAPTKVETSTAFAPDADPGDAFDELLAWEAQGWDRIAVFTHNPFVTTLAALLSRPSPNEMVFHTPTVLALGFDHGLERHSGRPLWALNP